MKDNFPALSQVQKDTRAQDALARQKIAEALGADKAAKDSHTSAEIPGDWTSANTMVMSGAVLGYSLIVLLVASIVVKYSKTPELALRLFSTVLIITSAVFLVVAGYSSQQIAPAFGLLGTMAGYVLGKSQARPGDENDPKA